MSFRPPHCPSSDCPSHQPSHEDQTWRCHRWGYFEADRHDEPEQRYRCQTCFKTFSRQTFRHDYGDRMPRLNTRLFELLSSGVGLRQSARLLGLACSTVQHKMRKIARSCAALHEHCSRNLPARRAYLLDEEESYEGASIRPLTVPIVIERDSWFVVTTGVAPIRRLAKKGTKRRAWQDAEEARCGKRPDESRMCVTQTLAKLADRTTGSLALHTDEKASYATICREVFGDRAEHETTSGKDPRTTRNPLFAINTTIAMSRDNCGRLRRRSWLVSKVGRFLQAQLHIFTVYRNYVRQRFNRDGRKLTPARVLELVKRRLLPDDVLRWRQAPGLCAIDPLSFLGERMIP